MKKAAKPQPPVSDCPHHWELWGSDRRFRRCGLCGDVSNTWNGTRARKVKRAVHVIQTSLWETEKENPQ